MADLRVPARLPPPATPARPLPPARVEAVRAAQRAFFETALAGDTQAASPARTAAATPAVSSAASPVPSAASVAAFDPSAPPPARPLRPGSLLDIKV